MQKQYEDEIKRASDEFNKKYAEYQQEQKNLPQNIQERRQKELQELSEKRYAVPAGCSAAVAESIRWHDGTDLQKNWKMPYRL